MDFDTNAIQENINQNKSEYELSKPNEPIITFSPDRSRFDHPGGQSHRLPTSSLVNDFDLNLEVSYSAAAANVNQYQNEPSTANSLAEILSASSPASISLLGPQNQISTFSNHGPFDPNTKQLNQFNLEELTSDMSLDLNHSQRNNINSTSNGNGIRESSILAMINVSDNKMSTSMSSTTSNGTSANTSQLQKKLEKKIAQASAIAATMNSMSSPLTSPEKDETFGDWNVSTTTPSVTDEKDLHAIALSDFQPNCNPSEPISKNKNATTSISKAKTSKSKSMSSNASTNMKSKSHTKSFHEDKKPACVKFQENEVEIISKSSRSKLPPGLLPPERLAIPHKNKGIRKTRSTSNENSDAPGHHAETSGDHSSAGGTTSEIKPLVEWDSDESEEELSFFPADKTRAKLTDNLSIDNMSLSDEDLHLSPPRHITQKCPCDPRQWVHDHVKLPKSKSFSGQNGQCCIS